MHRVVVVVVMLSAISGCTATRLRLKTDNQAATLADVYQRQVLDNLARFAHDAAALPFFAYASGGSTSLNNQVALSLYTLLNSQTQESWQLTPVNDPRKLELMRCLYQRVIAVHRRLAMRNDCPNCLKLFGKFYTGDPNLRVDQNVRVDRVEPDGRVTVDCLDGRRWLAIGCEKCARKRARSAVGRYRDVRVWTLPGGADELSKLTLAILDFALHDPPDRPTKSVTFHVTEQGELTTSGNAFADVSGQIPADAPNDTLLTLPYVRALEHLCAKRHDSLTVDELRRIGAAELNESANQAELAGRYHRTTEEWSEIRELLLKLKRHEVDSPLTIRASAKPATPTADRAETSLLPTPAAEPRSDVHDIEKEEP